MGGILYVFDYLIWSQGAYQEGINAIYMYIVQSLTQGLQAWEWVTVLSIAPMAYLIAVAVLSLVYAFDGAT